MERDPEAPYRRKYFDSLAQVLSVLRLSVALTTCRSRTRRDHIHALLTLSHHNGDDGKESKRFPAYYGVGGTGESLTTEDGREITRSDAKTGKEEKI